jgi:hypothetical protein
MSFVGPRPALFNQDDLVALRTEKEVHVLTPGLTGWAQINGRDELPIPIKVQFDEYYLKHRSLLPLRPEDPFFDLFQGSQKRRRFTLKADCFGLFRLFGLFGFNTKSLPILRQP